MINIKNAHKALVCSGLIGLFTSSSAMAYQLIDLGANVVPNAINNTGLVVGTSNVDQYPTTAFRWSDANGLEIIEGTSANAVNNAEQIAGNSTTGAFLLDGTKYSEWSDYAAFGLNELGQVGGYQIGSNPYQSASTPYNPAIYDDKKWVVFDIAQLYSRGTRLGVYADRFILNGINRDGFAVGYKYRYGLYGNSAILIDPNITVVDSSDVVYLPTPAGGLAADINDNNIVVGTTGSDSGAIPIIYSQAYSYDYTTDSVAILPLLDGGLHSGAYDINELNQVVGTSETLIDSNMVYHAFFYDQTTDINIDLNDWLIDGTLSAPGWVLVSANGVNDNGDIVGTGTLNGVSHGFLLTTASISSGQAPVAVASADVYRGKAPLIVNFDASGSSDPDGTIVDYFWDFMDGTSSTEISPTHEFTAPGTYIVTLTVTDDQSLQSSTDLSITVRKGRRK